MKAFSTYSTLYLLTTLLLIGASSIQVVNASATVYIRADGSVDPQTAPISTTDNVTYVLLGNIDDVVVIQRSNIVIEGAGNTVQGSGSGSGFSVDYVSNVTIREVNVRGFYYGLDLYSSSKILIQGSNITNNSYDGIRLVNSTDNTLSGNIIAYNGNDGVKLINSSNYNALQGNNIESNNDDGIQINDCIGNSFSVNTLSENVDMGIYSRYTSDTTIENNNITNNRLGIELFFSDNYIIKRNNVTAHIQSGIQLDSSSNSRILENKIESNYDGIYAYECSNIHISENDVASNGEYGIWLRLSSESNITGNNILANNAVGVYLRLSPRNLILGNSIAHNNNGIWLSGSSNNTIAKNDIAHNNIEGVRLFFTSSNAQLYHNDFINNTKHASSTTTSSWDDGLEGNYWSNYTGLDLDQNGIGDLPHMIDARNEDDLPLMGMFSDFNTSLGYLVHVISNSTIEDFEYFQYLTNETIRMHVSNVSSTQVGGFCRIRIPHTLMTDPYNVTIEGATPSHVNYTLYDDGEDRWIYFEYPHSTLEVLIYSLDIEPPLISLISPENETYLDDTVPLIFTINEPTSWIGYSLDGQANVTITGNTTLTSLSDDTHSIVVYANDTAGNMGHTETTLFTVNVPPPDIVMIYPENRTYATNSVPLTFTVNKPTSWIGYSLDGQANVTITGNTTLTSLSDDTHSIVVYANDTAGNMGSSNTIRFTTDTTPPNITAVSQIPLEDGVFPEDKVMVNATVTDLFAGVKRAILNYTNGNGTWIHATMTNLEGVIWNGTIPAFPNGTIITYTIIAEDNVNNTISTDDLGYEYQYSVIPEFPLQIALPLFMSIALLAVLLLRRKRFAKIL